MYHYVKICGFEFLSVHRRNICWLSALEIKLKALSATEPEIDCAIVISVIFRAYGEIWLEIDSDQIKSI